MSKQSSDTALSTKRNILWNTIGCTVNQGCMWAMTVAVVILTHGYTDSGLLAYAIAMGNIFFPLAVYNMRVVQVSDIANSICSGTYVAFRIVTVAIAFVILGIYLLLTSSSFEIIVVSTCWLLYQSDAAFVTVCYAIDQKAMRMDYVGRSQAVRGVISIGVFSCLLALQAGLCVAVLGVTVGCVLVTVFYDLPHAAKFESVRPHICLLDALHLLRAYLLPVIAVLCYSMVTSASRQIFEFGYGTEALGIYAAAAAPAALVPTLVQFIYMPLLGDIASKWHDLTPRSFIVTTLRFLLLILLMTGAAFLLSLVLGEAFLVLIFGESIKQYAYLLDYAILAMGATAAFMFLFDVLIAIRQLKGVLVSSLLAILISVTLTMPFSEAFYMNGINFAVILAFGIAFVLELLLVVYACRRREGHKWEE